MMKCNFVRLLLLLTAFVVYTEQVSVARSMKCGGSRAFVPLEFEMGFLRDIFQVLFFSSFFQLSLPTDPTYNAGVVEYTVQNGVAYDRTMETVYGYIDIIESPEAADLDIIVFPEFVLNRQLPTFVPDPAENVTPCYAPDYEMFLIELSCAARGRGVYVVVNLKEKELCKPGAPSDVLTPCPESGQRVFTTNVVFDRRGRVISRYRKTHLWRQEYLSTSVMRQPQVISFDTDFGVTFGHFVCFDMMFHEPAIRLLRERNITDIIYPTYWFSELPFLGALQLQEGWSFGNDVNLLAADGSYPAGKTSGSGIYAGRAGRLVAEIYEEPTRKLLTARVPKRNSGVSFELPPKTVPSFSPQLVTQRYTGLATFRDYNVDIFTTRLLEADFTNVSHSLCHGERFCCQFQLQRSPIGNSAEYATYRYRLAAYWGDETTVIRVDRSEQAVCAVFACLNEELTSCGRIFPATRSVANSHYFQHIRISGVFPAAERRLIMPSTLDGVMMPLDVSQYNWTESPPAKLLQETQVELELLQPKNDLLTFAIWANYYTKLPSSHGLNYMQPGWNEMQDGGSAATGGAAAAAVGRLLCLWLLPLIMLLRAV